MHHDFHILVHFCHIFYVGFHKKSESRPYQCERGQHLVTDE